MRRYPVNRLCALAGVTRQAFYKRDEDALLARLAIEQFVVQYVLEVRDKDAKIGMDKLWRMYSAKFPEEYRVGRDVFRSILHERGLNLRHRPRAICLNLKKVDTFGSNTKSKNETKDTDTSGVQ